MTCKLQTIIAVIYNMPNFEKTEEYKEMIKLGDKLDLQMVRTGSRGC